MVVVWGRVMWLWVLHSPPLGKTQTQRHTQLYTLLDTQTDATNPCNDTPSEVMTYLINLLDLTICHLMFLSGVWVRGSVCSGSWSSPPSS